MGRIVVLVVTVWMMVGMSSTAVAGEEAPMTEEQMELNERGVEALIEGRAARAVALLEEAMRLGELNVLALNLGRAYHGLGRCEEALDLLAGVEDLPAVDGVPVDRINERAAEYLQEVEATCRDDEEVEVDAPEIEGGEEPWVDAAEPPSRALGVGGVAAGSSLVAAGAGFFLLARHRRGQVTDYEGSVNTEVRQSEVSDIESRANTYDTIGLGAVITGAVVGGLGGYWLYRGREERGAETLDVSVGDGFRGISVRGRF